MKKSKIILSSALVFLAVIEIVILLQIIELSKSRESFEQTTVKIFDLQNEKLNLIDEELVKLSQDLDGLSENLDGLSKRNDGVQRKIQSLNRTYSELLEEQKNRSVDITKTDNAVLKIKKEMVSAYEVKNYSLCYEKTKSVLSIHSDDFETRRYKVLSAYKMNPMDSSKYEEILSDIQVLQQSGNSNNEIAEIQAVILTERS